MFKITKGSGFHMQFANGWTVSVQFGFRNYRDNQYRPEDFAQLFNGEPDTRSDPISSTTAEIAAWNVDGNWHDFGHGVVKGWVEPADVLEFMNMIAALPAEASDVE